MGIERRSINFNGLLVDGTIAGQLALDYAITITKVTLETLGNNPSGSALAVQIRKDSSTQAATYTLPAGLKYAENTVSGGGLAVAADVSVDVIINASASAADLVVTLEWTTAAAVTSTDTTDLNLGSLGQLKEYLLTQGIRTETTYDTALVKIGKGIAAAFDGYTNRILKRGTSVTQQFMAPRRCLVLERYPIEGTPTIELKTDQTTGFETQTGVVLNVNSENGIVELTSDLGVFQSVIRATYSGGYWYDTSADESGTLPSGATTLPGDITFAWLAQCQHVWESRDDLGLVHTGGQFLHTRLGYLELIPQVKEILDGYVRYVLL